MKSAMKDGKSRRRRKVDCFVIMPSGAGSEYRGGPAEADYVYRRLIRPIVRRVAKECGVRTRIRVAVESVTPAPIADEIVERLANSQIVIADLTGRNPNVYYELGIRYAVDGTGTRPTVSIAQSECDLAFDVAHIRAVVYGTEAWDWRKSRRRLRRAVREAFNVITGGTTSANWNPVQRVLRPEQNVMPPLQLVGQAEMFKRTWHFANQRITIVASSQEAERESAMARHYSHSTGSGQFYSLGLLLPPLALAYPARRIEMFLADQMEDSDAIDGDLILLGGATNSQTVQLLKDQPIPGLIYDPAPPESHEYSKVTHVNERDDVIEKWTVTPSGTTAGDCPIEADFGIVVLTRLHRRPASRVLIGFGGTTYGTEAAARFIVDPGDACEDIRRLKPYEGIVFAVRTNVKGHRCGERIEEPKCLGTFDCGKAYHSEYC